MQHIEKQVGEIDDKVTNILTILRGHEMDRDDKGMIGVQNDHERRITRLEKYVNNGFWFILGISIPAGWGIIDIIQKIILKK